MTVRPRVRALVLAVFAVVFCASSVHRYTQQSATWDEPMHLTAGYFALAQGDYRMDTSHPPLVRMWAALPLLVAPPMGADPAAIDATPALRWLTEGYQFAHEFLYVHNDADRLLYAARFMMVLLGVLLGVLIFAWTYEWLGFPPALLALAFYTLEPNLTAHATLVTTDLGLTCFAFGAVYFLWRTCRRYSAGNLAGLALFVALAVVTKFSAVLLGPMLLLLLAVSVLRRSEMTLRRAVAAVALLVLVTVAAVWAVYGFRHAPSRSPGWTLQLEGTSAARRTPVVAGIVGWIDGHRLLPNAFSQGFLYNYASVQGVPGYLFGESREGGWWYYFPAAFFLKTPIALPVLVAAGFWFGVRRRRARGGAGAAFVIVPVVVFLGIAMHSGVNMGVRHILPVFPFLLLVAAAGAQALLPRAARVAPVGVPQVALAVLLVLWVAELLRAYPHHLTFFNAAAGGPAGGFRHLSDSNLAWGGDLKALRRWMDAAGVSHVNLAYFGSAAPAYYGIDATYLPGSPSFAESLVAAPRLPGHVALSATTLTGVYLEPAWRLFYRGFLHLEPVALVGNSMRVYRVEAWPEAALAPGELAAYLDLADQLLVSGWYSEAVVHYRGYLRYRPDDPNALTRFGVALAESGRLDEAVESFARVAARMPGDSQAQRNLAEARRRAQTAETGSEP